MAPAIAMTSPPRLRSVRIAAGEGIVAAAWVAVGINRRGSSWKDAAKPDAANPPVAPAETGAAGGGAWLTSSEGNDSIASVSRDESDISVSSDRGTLLKTGLGGGAASLLR